MQTYEIEFGFYFVNSDGTTSYKNQYEKLQFQADDNLHALNKLLDYYVRSFKYRRIYCISYIRVLPENVSSGNF